MRGTSQKRLINVVSCPLPLTFFFFLKVTSSSIETLEPWAHFSSVTAFQLQIRSLHKMCQDGLEATSKANAELAHITDRF